MAIAPRIIAAALLLAGCGGGGGSGNVAAPQQGGSATNAAALPGGGATAQEGGGADPSADSRWALESSGEGAALVLRTGAGGEQMRLICPAGGARLIVNVRGFRPVGSEERLSFGGGGEAAALVADVRGDSRRGGVTGAGEAPEALAAMLAGPVSASYGAQVAGPHPPPPPDAAAAFVAACAERPAPPPPAGRVSACLVQDGVRLDVARLRAVGTEPFWGARIEGRCVTYSHPEDQQGTRVWTRYTAAPGGGGSWSGALGGSRFELRIRPQPGCSDGMSDTRYPLAAELLVAGERRQGCAQPL